MRWIGARFFHRLSIEASNVKQRHFMLCLLQREIHFIIGLKPMSDRFFSVIWHSILWERRWKGAREREKSTQRAYRVRFSSTHWPKMFYAIPIFPFLTAACDIGCHNNRSKWHSRSSTEHITTLVSHAVEHTRGHLFYVRSSTKSNGFSSSENLMTKFISRHSWKETLNVICERSKIGARTTRKCIHTWLTALVIWFYMRQTKFKAKIFKRHMQETKSEQLSRRASKRAVTEGEWEKREHLLFIAQCHNLRMFIT